MIKKQIEGDVEHGFADADTNKPIKIGGRARQTNPTAVFDTERVEATFDDLGRQIVVPFQVRDLIATGSATLTRGTETSIIAGVASTLQDIVTVTGANTSGNAITVDIRFGTAGSIIEKITIPATSSASKQYQVPIPMSEVAQAITGQTTGISDQSDSPVTITILAVRNI